MKKLTFLSIVSIILVSVNITLLVYLFQNQNNSIHKPPHGKGPKNLIIEKLHLDNEQVIQYESLIEEHRASIRKTERDIHQLKSRLYKSLSNSVPEAEKEEIIEAIGMKHQELENIHLKHFNDIKQLCNEEQLIYFNELANDLSSLFRKPPPPPHRR